MNPIIVVSETVINLNHLVQSTQARHKSIRELDLINTLNLTADEVKILSEEHVRQILVFDNGQTFELFRPEDIASFLEQCRMKSYEITK